MPAPRFRRLAATLAALGALAACTRRAEPAPPPATPAGAMAFGDGVTATSVAAGVLHRTYTLARGPNVVHVLDVDRARCWRAEARKAGDGAIGRAGTLALIAALHDSATVAGGVNADFFSFSPPGVPVSAHIHRMAVVAGPSARPVLAFDLDGAPWIGSLSVRGHVILGAATLADTPLATGQGAAGARRDSVPIAAWNRSTRDGLALYDSLWGRATDSVPGRLFVRLEAQTRGQGFVDGADRGRPAFFHALVGRVVSVDSGAVATVDGRPVLALGAGAPAGLRAAFARVRAGDRVFAQLQLAPFQPAEAVGGFPVLLRDGAIDPAIDSAGSPSFRGPNPRTAVGIADSGRRLLLVTVDGRQPGYSVGMSLRELAELMRALGARDALNLDGGGSTTFVVAPATGAPMIANRPSDKTGERPVANALAVVNGCETVQPPAQAAPRSTP